MHGGILMSEELPDNPFDHQREGAMFLRLSNDCPPDGIIMEIRGFKIGKNQRGDREYHWDIVHFNPRPIKKTCTESTKGFCTALSEIADKPSDLKGKVLQVRWQHEELSRGKNMKVWDIKELSSDDLKTIFPES
jgi:hypothetical protein